MRVGKGLKPRTTVLSDLDALPLVERWLEERGKLEAMGQAYASDSGEPLDERRLRPRPQENENLTRSISLRCTFCAVRL